ncbi:MAG: LysR family transcriptional regulator [Lachnospiraceae bacterium]|nr:LysR family transcriptional regulator [Lachnospiraceae bacterium]
MTIRHLRVFNEVCKYMNMTHASRALHVSQPSISATISELEEWYGVKLFERLNKKLYLTDAGRTIYQHSVYLVDMFDRIESEIRQSASVNRLRIGASVTIGTSILSDLISSYKTISPDISYQVYIENTENIQELLLNNDIDIALIEGQISDPSLVSELFAESEIVAVYGRNHPFYEKEEITREDLEAADYIVREEGSNTRVQFEKAMAALDIPWHASWVCHNTQAIKNAVAAGHGVGVLSRLSVRRRLRTGEFRAIPLGEVRAKFYIVYHRDKFMTKQLKEFKQFVVNSIQNVDM